MATLTEMIIKAHNKPGFRELLPEPYCVEVSDHSVDVAGVYVSLKAKMPHTHGIVIWHGQYGSTQGTIHENFWPGFMNFQSVVSHLKMQLENFLREDPHKMDQESLTDLICVSLPDLGPQEVREILPQPLQIEYRDHSTGRNATIYAKAPELPKIEVWYGSYWFSKQYEFNDEGRVLGIQPDCEWAVPVLNNFFTKLHQKWDEHLLQKEKTRQEFLRISEETAKRKRDEAVSVYSKMLSPQRRSRSSNTN